MTSSRDIDIDIIIDCPFYDKVQEVISVGSKVIRIGVRWRERERDSIIIYLGINRKVSFINIS